MDTTYLLDLAGGSTAIVREILDDFFRADAEDRRELAAALAAGNRTEVRTFVHRIKGAALSIGATDYAQVALSVENGAESSADLQEGVVALLQAGQAFADWGTTYGG